jgi:hypothetical protein
MPDKLRNLPVRWLLLLIALLCLTTNGWSQCWENTSTLRVEFHLIKAQIFQQYDFKPEQLDQFVLIHCTDDGSVRTWEFTFHSSGGDKIIDILGSTGENIPHDQAPPRWIRRSVLEIACSEFPDCPGDCDE